MTGWPPTVDVAPVGEGEHLVERRGDPVDGADRDRLARRPTTSRRARSRSPTRRSGRASSAIERILAIASLRTLSPSVPSMSSPPAADRRRGADARAGRHERHVGGERDERAGTRGAPAGRRDPDDRSARGASSSVQTISWVASRLPPGVFSWITTAAAPSRAARAIALCEIARHDLVDDARRRSGRDRRRPASAARSDAHRQAPKQPQQEGNPYDGSSESATHPGFSCGFIVLPAPPRASKTRRLQVSSPVDDRGDVGGRRERRRELVGLADRRPAARRARRRTPPPGGRGRPASCRRSAGRRGGSRARSRRSSSSAHSRRSPPSRSPSPGLRWPPTPIDQRSCSRASPPARVRRIRK